MLSGDAFILIFPLQQGIVVPHLPAVLPFNYFLLYLISDTFLLWLGTIPTIFFFKLARRKLSRFKTVKGFPQTASRQYSAYSDIYPRAHKTETLPTFITIKTLHFFYNFCNSYVCLISEIIMKNICQILESVHFSLLYINRHNDTKY